MRKWLLAVFLIIVASVVLLRQPVTCYFFLRDTSGERIAYLQRDTGLYLMDTQGSGQCQLVSGDFMNVAWSPDGTQLALIKDGDYNLYVVNADGSNLRQVADGVGAWTNITVPAWSPAGTQLAYINAGEAESEIYIVDLASGNTHSITPGLRAGAPTWSPDGERVAFQGLDAFYQVRVDGSELTELDSPIPPYYVQAWSSDSSQLAYIDGDYDLALINADGSNKRKLTTDFPDDQTPANPRWSPDGTRIAVRGTDIENYPVYVIDAASGEIVQQIEAYDGLNVDWTHDGANLIYTSSTNDFPAATFIVPAAGGASRLLGAGIRPALKP